MTNLYIPEKYPGSIDVLQKVTEIASQYYQQNDTVHDFDHALRVTRLAIQLGQEEGGDLELLALAGLLHDTARHEQVLTGVCHAQRGAVIAGEILNTLGYDLQRTRHIQEMIRTHRFRDQSVPATLEAQILYDADKLDAIGAVGIARSYAICGRDHQKIYSTLEDHSNDHYQLENFSSYSPVAEYEFKLSKIIDKMLTKTGRKLAVQRDQFMKQFIEELKAEVEGIR